MEELWGKVKNLGEASEDDLVATLEGLAKAIKPPLPAMVRPDIIRDACALLVAPSEKPLIERVKFLTLQEVKPNEISMALRVLPILPTLEDDDIIRASRHFRIDMVEAAVAFFNSDQVKRFTLEDKITYLQRKKELGDDEIDEALDRVNIERVIEATWDESPGSTKLGTRIPPANTLRDEKIRIAKEFLKSDAARNASPEDVRGILRKYGFEESDVESLIIGHRVELIAKAQKFLQSKAAANATREDVKAFLKKQGLDEADIDTLMAGNVPKIPPFTPLQPTSIPPPTTKSATISPKAPAPAPAPENSPSEVLDKLASSAFVAPGKETQAAPSTSATSSPPASEQKDPDEDLPIIQQAVRFLMSPEAKVTKNENDLDLFLFKKGLSRKQIDLARKKAGRMPSALTQSVAVTSSNVARALSFFRNPASQSVSIEQKIAFLRSKGISEDEIRQAYEQFMGGGPGISRNLTNATRVSQGIVRMPVNATSAAAKVEVIPGLGSMALIATRALRQLKNVSFRVQLAITSYYAVVLAFSRNRLRLSNPIIAHLIEHLNAAVVQLIGGISTLKIDDSKTETENAPSDDKDAKNNPPDYGALCEGIIADLCEVAGTGMWKQCFELALCPFVYEILKAPIVHLGDRQAVWISFMRCIHGHFSSRASVSAYKAVEHIYLMKWPTIEAEASAKAALLRGSVDFGCGVNAPRVPMEEKTAVNTQPEVGMKERLNDVAKQNPEAFEVGLACVYAGRVWLNSLDTFRCIEAQIFKGALDTSDFSSLTNVDDCATHATTLIMRVGFRLVATSAQLLVQQSTDDDAIRKDMQKRAIEHADEVFRTTRNNKPIREVLARRMVERTYDEALFSLSLEDSLGPHAQFARFFQTHYLIAVVMFEAACGFNSELEELVEVVCALASLGFGLVPAPEANTLNKFLRATIGLNMEESFEFTAKYGFRWAESDEGSRTQTFERLAKDWVVGAQFEYLHDVLGNILLPTWEQGALQRADKVDKSVDLLARALVVHAGHKFDRLRKRCHGFILKGVKMSSAVSTDQASTTDSSDDGAEGTRPCPPSLALALFPQYFFQTSLSCPEATTRVEFSYAVGDSFTSLGSSSDPNAGMLVTSAFRRILLVARRSVATQRTRADVLLETAFAALKACPLPSLAPCLDGIESLLRSLAFGELYMEENKKAVAKRYRDMLLATISRVDDSARRAILVMWYFKSIEPHELPDVEDPVDTTTAKL